MTTPTITSRPWLDEITRRHGDSLISSGPAMLRGNDGRYQRESWTWFPGGRNCTLTVDLYADGHWMIRASSPRSRAQLEDRGSPGPSAAEVRRVLVLAGMLEDDDDN